MFLSISGAQLDEKRYPSSQEDRFFEIKNRSFFKLIVSCYPLGWLRHVDRHLRCLFFKENCGDPKHVKNLGES